MVLHRFTGKINPNSRIEVPPNSTRHENIQKRRPIQGEDDYNLHLSQRRAEAVVAYLGLFGVDKGRLVPKGYGKAKPVMDNGDFSIISFNWTSLLVSASLIWSNSET